MVRLLRNGKAIGGVLIVGVLVAVAAWPRAQEVDTAVVTRGPLMVTLDEDGETRVRHRFVVTAPMPGEVRRIELQAGDRVKKGMAVATLRAAAPVPIDARSRAEGEAAERSAEAVVGRVRAEYNRAVAMRDRVGQQTARTRTLAGGGALPREELDAREAELQTAVENVRAAEYAIAQAEHEVEVARARLAPRAPMSAGREYAIVSPVDGVVLKRYRESESVVPAGEPLLEIGDASALEIVADFLSADAVKIVPGAEVLIDHWGGSHVLHGRVRRVEPAAFTKVSALGVEEQRVNVRIDFDGTSEVAVLGDNFGVEVRVVLWKSDAVVKAPPGSLFRQGEGWAVYAVVDGRADVRPVVLGHRNDAEAEVSSGIDEGAVVVVYPPDTLRTGVRLTTRRR
ncbi:MAG: HlyD family efflux transporter periplasmic adaptor subunit [Vicinamibacterales bacterium]